ncbi:MAG TPA: gamma-glutamyltransferase family protein [Candidatus Limnocylindria bacterium]|nr:gamma-glutamyltransferase family protein [Candidatus Limnocylindria bacterium]
MPSTSAWRIAKTEAVGERAMVVADDPHATRAGVRALEDGGNAVDAAIAAAFVMGVAEPLTSGVGGVATMVLRTPDGRVTVIDGSTVAPRAAREDMFELVDAGGRSGMYGWPMAKDDANNVGWRAVGVPGMVAACLYALERYGTLPRERILEDAIALAEQGRVVDWYLGLAIGTYAYRLLRFPGSKRIFFRPEGAPLRVATGFEPADRLVQPDLARVLREIARGGADAFYRGDVAAEIARDVQANGGILTREELAAYEPREVAPLRSSYRGVDLFTIAGPGGGTTAVEILNLLEGFDLRRTPQGSAAELHLVAEASRRAFADRFAHLADVPGAPFERLASKEWARTRAIDPARATPDEGPGRVSHDPDRTTNICVVDGEGRMVTLTSTLGGAFGACVVPKGTGVVLANVMTWFDPRPGTINSAAPGKRILWAPSPTVLLRDGRPFACVGAPGGRRIMSAVPQTIVHLVDHGDGPQDAVSRPRVHCEGRETMVDSRFPTGVLDELARMGHELALKDETFFSANFARPGAIVVKDDGTLRGGVNVFKPAIATGL